MGTASSSEVTPVQTSDQFKALTKVPSRFLDQVRVS